MTVTGTVLGLTTDQDRACREASTMTTTASITGGRGCLGICPGLHHRIELCRFVEPWNSNA